MYTVKSYCISLRKNYKERKRCKKIYDKQLLNVDFHVVDRSVLGGIHGCFTSHIDVLKKGIKHFKNNKTKNQFIFIMEDDVYFECDNIVDIFTNLPNNNNIWCCCLGYFSTSFATFIKPNMISLSSCNCMHAYIVPIQTAKQLVKLKWNNQPIDYEWNNVIDIFYAPYPMIAYQKDHPSSVGSGIFDIIMKRIGFKNIALGFQFWCTYGYILLFLIVLIIIILFIKIKFII